MKKSFPEKVEELRGTRTQKEFAKLLGIPLNTYTNWIREITFPSGESLITIHTVLGVSSDWLLGISPYKYGSAQVLTENHPHKSAPPAMAEPPAWAIHREMPEGYIAAAATLDAAYWRDLALSQQSTIASLTDQLREMGKANRAKTQHAPASGSRLHAG